MILNLEFEVEVVRLFHLEEIRLFIVSIVGGEVSLNFVFRGICLLDMRWGIFGGSNLGLGGNNLNNI